MSTLRLTILAALVTAPCVFAADSTKPALPKKTVPTLDVKARSSFELAAGSRNPFLPIGWKGSAVVTKVSSKKHVAPAEAFRVTSILVGSPSLAVINGRSYEEGQMIRMPRDPKANPNIPPPRAKLFRIGDGAVQIQLEDQMLVVPLKRAGEFKEIQPELLLDPDREQ